MKRGTNDLIRKKANTGSQGKNKEDIIHKALTSSGFRIIREFPVKHERFQQKMGMRNVDMKITYGHMELYLESDGKVHGTLETPTFSTQKRNMDFNRAKMNYILINHESIKELRKIMELKNITVEQLTEFLATYRAWEEYSKYLSNPPEGDYIL